MSWRSSAPWTSSSGRSIDEREAVGGRRFANFRCLRRVFRAGRGQRRFAAPCGSACGHQGDGARQAARPDGRGHGPGAHQGAGAGGRLRRAQSARRTDRDRGVDGDVARQRGETRPAHRHGGAGLRGEIFARRIAPDPGVPRVARGKAPPGRDPGDDATGHPAVGRDEPRHDAGVVRAREAAPAAGTSRGVGDVQVSRGVVMSVIGKRVVNIDELKLEHFEKGDKYACDAVRIGPLLGAKDLGYSYDVVPPGKRSGPFHSHYGEEEMFFIVKGAGTLRYGNETRKVRAGDFICCPTGGAQTAHQLVNDSSEPLAYISVSTMMPAEVCEYPDSRKVGSYGGRTPSRLKHMTTADSAVDYWKDETRAPLRPRSACSPPMRWRRSS